ncbi:Imm50 family immunity protein [Hymenobacter actinosclerus]|uniref:Imm50 family immunity protein n=1 Tax=Hymenobacter actinosclerus TaxID=82805 RepID=UPI000B8473A0|nr:Imm50 family immunity protein [Hymenobacter actinosclerus]
MSEKQNPAIARIINAKVIHEHFGYWPGFHDAEITKVTLEAHPGYWPSATFVVASFEMTKELDEKGYYKHTKQCDIEFQFTGIQEIEFDYFNHQNVILNLTFEESGDFIKCTFDPSVGLDAVIIAEKIAVSLIPKKR